MPHVDTANMLPLGDLSSKGSNRLPAQQTAKPPGLPTPSGRSMSHTDPVAGAASTLGSTLYDRYANQTTSTQSHRPKPPATTQAAAAPPDKKPVQMPVSVPGVAQPVSQRTGMPSWEEWRKDPEAHADRLRYEQAAMEHRRQQLQHTLRERQNLDDLYLSNQISLDERNQYGQEFGVGAYREPTSNQVASQGRMGGRRQQEEMIDAYERMVQETQIKAYLDSSLDAGRLTPEAHAQYYQQFGFGDPSTSRPVPQRRPSHRTQIFSKLRGLAGSGPNARDRLGQLNNDPNVMRLLEDGSEEALAEAKAYVDIYYPEEQSSWYWPFG